MMTLYHLMIECFGKGCRCRSLAKTLSARKNKLSNVTTLSLGERRLLTFFFKWALHFLLNWMLWFYSYEENHMQCLCFWSYINSWLMEKRKHVPRHYCRIWNIQRSSMLGTELLILFSCLRHFIKSKGKHRLHSEQFISAYLFIILNSIVYISSCLDIPNDVFFTSL